MIKIDKNQRKRLIEVCEEFDEHAIGNSLLITRVREHRMRTIEVDVEVAEGEKPRKEFKMFSLPELENDPKQAHTPIYCGVVLSVGPNDDSGLIQGDLIRYTPLSAEEVSSSDGSYTFLRIDQYSIRTKSHNIFAKGIDHMFCEPPPDNVKVN